MNPSSQGGQEEDQAAIAGQNLNTINRASRAGQGGPHANKNSDGENDSFIASEG